MAVSYESNVNDIRSFKMDTAVESGFRTTTPRRSSLAGMGCHSDDALLFTIRSVLPIGRSGCVLALRLRASLVLREDLGRPVPAGRASRGREIITGVEGVPGGSAGTLLHVLEHF